MASPLQRESPVDVGLSTTTAQTTKFGSMDCGASGNTIPLSKACQRGAVSEMAVDARRVASISETRGAKILCMAGRPHKGPRHVIVTRPAKPVADVVMSEAAAAGMTISDYVAGVLARAVGLPQYIPVSPAHNQQELPLKSA